MEFDKSKVYSAANADEVKIGSKIIVADCFGDLKQSVLENEEPVTLLEILDEYTNYRFKIQNEFNSKYAFAYLVSEPEEEKLKWTDLDVGDVIKNGQVTAMVTAIDSEKTNRCILIGDTWLTDEELKYWGKVEC
jgi:hypothetical protein